MDILKSLFDYFIHIDEHLNTLIQNYGAWTYGILIAIIFCETGLVITPFLPGDSLLFAAGAFAATGSLNVWLLFILLSLAAVIGDTVNYWIGHFAGEKVFTDHSRILKREYLQRTHKFYEKYGGLTIILARFVPIVRTVAPFVAGVGKMTYGRFLMFNLAGGVLWIGLFTFLGYFFGNLPFVKAHFEWVIVVIVLISLVPAIFESIRHRWKKEKSSPRPESLLN